MPFDSSKIASFEEFWVEHQPFLLSRGYKLRPRFDPKWTPSWLKGNKPIKMHKCEDSVYNTAGVLIDAISIRDGKKVVLKRVKTWKNEITVGQFLTSQAMLSDPRNRSVPILDVILLPHDDLEALIVMPLLFGFSLIPFRRVGEFSEAFLQFLQGLEFMHEHNVVHRDACHLNLMMDPMKVIPKGFHFSKWYTRDGIEKRLKWHDRWQVRPVDYYFIDFGLSYRYPAGYTDILDYGIYGQDSSVPEMSIDIPYDPFKADVYQLGNAFKKLIEEYEGLELFLPLSIQMTFSNPTDRPTAAEAVKQFKTLLSNIKVSQLRRRAWLKETEPSIRFRVRFLNENWL